MTTSPTSDPANYAWAKTGHANSRAHLTVATVTGPKRLALCGTRVRTVGVERPSPTAWCYRCWQSAKARGIDPTDVGSGWRPVSPSKPAGASDDQPPTNPAAGPQAPAGGPTGGKSDAGPDSLRTVWVLTYGRANAYYARDASRQVKILAADEDEARSAANHYRKRGEQLTSVYDTGEPEYEWLTHGRVV